MARAALISTKRARQVTTQRLRRKYFGKDEAQDVSTPRRRTLLQSGQGGARLHLSRPSALQPGTQEQCDGGVVNMTLPPPSSFQKYFTGVRGCETPGLPPTNGRYL